MKRTISQTLAAVFLLGFSGCCEIFGDCDDDPAIADVSGGWVGYACDGTVEGVINASFSMDGEQVSGSWVMQLGAPENALRGDLSGTVSDGRLTATLVQETPCAGEYTLEGPASDSVLRLSLTGSDCDATRAIEIEMGSFGSTVSSPCSGASSPIGGSGPGGNSGPQSLVEAVAAASLMRSPFVLAPFGGELPALFARDQQRSAQVSWQLESVFDPLVTGRLASVGVSGFQPFPGGFAARDMFAATGFGGGMAGHDVMFLDGKYLAILAELATWRARFELGLATQGSFDAINQIVAAHNQDPGLSPDGIIYRRSQQAAAVASLAQQWERWYSAPMILHEFGHIYGWHELLHLRAMGGVVFLFPSETEDQADRIAGMLMAKAGVPYEAAIDAYDVLFFYLAQRQSPFVQIQNILSFSFQNTSQTPTYSPPATRKSLIEWGYREMEAELGVSVPSFAPLFAPADFPAPSAPILIETCCRGGAIHGHVRARK